MDRRIVTINDRWLLRADPEDVGRKEDYALHPEGKEVDLPYPSPRGQSVNTLATTKEADINRRPALCPDLLFEHLEGPVWYYRRLDTLPDHNDSDRIILHIAAADFLCEVYLNGRSVGIHENAEAHFSFDVTDYLDAEDNLLAIRLISPTPGREYEGCPSITEMPNNGRSYAYYTFYSSCALYADVFLEASAAPCIQDVHLIADLTGEKVSATVFFDNPEKTDTEITLSVFWGDKLMEEQTIHSPEETACLTVRVDDPLRWSPEEPNLYTAGIRIARGQRQDYRLLRFGFRTLAVHDGYFYLNGNRIFLKSAHTGHLSKREIAQAKAMGIRMLRILSRLPDERTMAYCDEVGMMLYAECAVSWGMTDHDRTEAQMEAYLSNMMKACRNHVSVCMYGLFNETGGGNPELTPPKLPSKRTVDWAISHLKDLRRLDPTRIILLGSGRWDARIGVGSFSNPYSDTWDCQWGAEEPGRTDLAQKCKLEFDPYIMGMGDNHMYPYVPLNNKTISFLLHMGEDSNPVFLSEYGVGSQLYLPALERYYIEAGLKSHRSALYYGKQHDELRSFTDKFDLGDIYQCPEDFLLASVKMAAVQRIRSMDPVRANPHICGYSLTSYGISNEGVYFAPDRYMPGIVEALHESFAPLRWCILPEKRVINAGDSLDLTVMLATERDILPGTHYAEIAIRGKKGILMRKKYAFDYPETAPLAVEVLKDSFVISREGEYTLSLHLDGLVQPTCGETVIRVLPVTGSLADCRVRLLGDLGQTASFLAEKGLGEAEEDTSVYLVGEKLSETEKEHIRETAKNGGTIITLSPTFWDEKSEEDKGFMSKMVMPGEKNSLVGKKFRIRNWLYHMDCYAGDSPVFEELSDAGLLDMDIFGSAHPTEYMVDSQKPSLTHCAAFGTGMFTETGCVSGLVLGEIPYGKGKFVLNTFQILSAIRENPAAQRLLYNLIRYYGRKD